MYDPWMDEGGHPSTLLVVTGSYTGSPVRVQVPPCGGGG